MGMLIPMPELSTQLVSTWLKDYADVINENTNYLTDLDRQIGDADHGSNMSRGMAAVAALDPTTFPDAPALLKKAGMTLVSTVGGASGPLYGTFFLRLGTSLPAAGQLDAATLAAAMKAGLDGIVARGKASLGDKTLVDCLSSAVDAAQKAANEGKSFAEALAAASKGADEGRDATVDMIARRGRASYLGERSKGHLDPGAASMAMLIDSAARTLA